MTFWQSDPRDASSLMTSDMRFIAPGGWDTETTRSVEAPALQRSEVRDWSLITEETG